MWHHQCHAKLGTDLLIGSGVATKNSGAWVLGDKVYARTKKLMR